MKRQTPFAALRYLHRRTAPEPFEQRTLRVFNGAVSIDAVPTCTARRASEISRIAGLRGRYCEAIVNKMGKYFTIPQEVRYRISRALIGRRLSDETRHRMREAKLAQFEAARAAIAEEARRA